MYLKKKNLLEYTTIEKKKINVRKKKYTNYNFGILLWHWVQKFSSLYYI